MTKYLKQIQHLAEEYGFRRVRGGGRRHLIYRNHKGAQISVSASPSDHRSLLNLRSLMRRYS
jgi:predicted RNA binding protein YcfA (HicA-like mRNA interferase family)